MDKLSYGIQFKPLKEADNEMDNISIPKEYLEAYWTKRAKSDELIKLFKQQDDTMLKAFQQQIESLTNYTETNSLNSSL